MVYTLDEVKEIALKFSEENNIVKSKESANMKTENGLDGNPKGAISLRIAKIFILFTFLKKSKVIA